jgi:hypothetical protein
MSAKPPCGERSHECETLAVLTLTTIARQVVNEGAGVTPYQYGEMFERLGVPGMGRQGSGWCGIGANGVLVLMSHQNFHHRKNDAWYYDAPGDERLPTISSSAARSIRMIAQYAERLTDIILPVGVFASEAKYCRMDGTNQRCLSMLRARTIERPSASSKRRPVISFATLLANSRSIGSPSMTGIKL